MLLLIFIVLLPVFIILSSGEILKIGVMPSAVYQDTDILERDITF